MDSRVDSTEGKCMKTGEFSDRQLSNQLSYVPQRLRRISSCITLIPRGLGKHRYDLGAVE
jgi:hypothetical protein